jgi:hypothetical protein
VPEFYLRRPDGNVVDPDTGESVPKRFREPGIPIVSEDELGQEAALGQDQPSSLDTAGLQAPQQGLGKADIGFKLLEILGGIGGGIARNRAVGQANKATAAGQAQANLLNVLSGGSGARGPQVQPEVGIGGTLLDALGGIGKMGGEALEQRRGFERQGFEDELDLFGVESSRITSEAALERAKAAGIRAQTAGDKITATDRMAAEDVGFSTHKSGGTLEDVEAAIIAQLGDRPQLIAVAKAEWGKRDDATNEDEYDRGRDKRRDELAETREVRAAVEARSGELSRSMVPVKDAVTNSIELADGSVLPRYADIFAENFAKVINSFAQRDVRLTKEETAFIASHLEAAYTAGRVRLMKRLAASGGLSNQARMSLADVAAMNRKADQLNEMMSKAILSGPIFGRIPALQFFVPDDAVFDGYGEAFALELASVLNRGRPSEKDFEAARKIVPMRRDREGVRAKKLEAIKAMLASRASGIEAQFPPVLTVVGNETDGFEIVEDKTRRVAQSEQKAQDAEDEGEGEGEGEPRDVNRGKGEIPDPKDLGF